MIALWLFLFGVVLGVGFTALFCLLALVPARKTPSPFDGGKRFSLTARKASATGGKHGTGPARTDARGDRNNNQVKTGDK